MIPSLHLKPMIALKYATILFFRGSCDASLSWLAYVHNGNNIPMTNNFGCGSGVRFGITLSKSNPFLLNMVLPNEKDYTSPMRQRPRPEGGDVAYTNENILRQFRYYNTILQVGGEDCIMDIYARDPNPTSTSQINSAAAAAAIAELPSANKEKKKSINEKEQRPSVRYWFVGKVARCTGTVSPEQAVARQYNLLEEHVCRIRPIELGRHFGTIELFMAPGNTEMAMLQNDPCIQLQKVPRYTTEDVKQVALLEVGLNLEIVTNQGVGFCIYRDDDG